MASTKEIKNHMDSVHDTRKITGAMHMISANKLQRAKRELDLTRPYFDAVRGEIKRIFRTVEDVESRYFFPARGERDFEGTYGYLVITADKGLAGSYNQSAIRQALYMMDQHDDNRLFVVGEYGRQYFGAHRIPFERDFQYTAQNPTMTRAREISSRLVEAYNAGELKKIFVVYTDFSSGLENEARTTRLLPFHRSSFTGDGEQHPADPHFEFAPSLEQVLDNIIPSYITGFVYSALVSSFCSEETARMRAMDNANTNAEKLLDELEMQYHHIRQSDITREITEISSGSRSQKKSALKHQKER